jgi:hypothetical protein
MNPTEICIGQFKEVLQMKKLLFAPFLAMALILTVITPAVAADISYIGNRNSKIFHSLGCSSLPAEKNQVYFESRNSAIEAGYRGCQKCKP